MPLDLPAGMESAQADRRVHEHAAQEVQREPRVELERLVAQAGGKLGGEQKEVDGIAGQDRYRVLNPAARGHEGLTEGDRMSGSPLCRHTRESFPVPLGERVVITGVWRWAVQESNRLR